VTLSPARHAPVFKRPVRARLDSAARRGLKKPAGIAAFSRWAAAIAHGPQHVAMMLLEQAAGCGIDLGDIGLVGTAPAM
jgi:hypothetical protein